MFIKYMSKTFAQFNPSTNSGEHTQNKKTQYLCKPRYCAPNTNLNSQQNYISIKKDKYLNSNLCNRIDNTQLYINLFTKLDVTDATIVTPTTVDDIENPFLTYNIDPSGNLFGNSLCGIDNWKHYIRAYK